MRAAADCWTAVPPRSVVYYSGYHMFCPSFVTNGTAAMLVSLMMGPGASGSPKMPLAPTITPFTIVSGKLKAGSTFAFPSKARNCAVRDPAAYGDPPAAAAGHYTSAAVDEAGGMWGAGMTVDRHANDDIKLHNWATVVFRAA
jgi:hypothetical protein